MKYFGNLFTPFKLPNNCKINLFYFFNLRHSVIPCKKISLLRKERYFDLEFFIHQKYGSLCLNLLATLYSKRIFYFVCMPDQNSNSYFEYHPSFEIQKREYIFVRALFFVQNPGSEFSQKTDI